MKKFVEWEECATGRGACQDGLERGKRSSEFNW